MRYGHFDDDNKEYVITTPKTPYPWINYLGSESFFGLISHQAGGYCFYRDARLRRLTRFRYNNVPTDSGGRYYYIREENGDYWSPSFMPVKEKLDSFECRHGLGYTRITGVRQGLSVEALFFVPVGHTAEVHQLTLKNTTGAPRKVKLFSFVEFCLWNAHDDQTNFQRNFSTGEVEIDGAHLLNASRSAKRDLLKRAQIIFQNPDSSLNPRKSIGETLERPLELVGLGREERRKRVTELLDLVRLDASYAERYPHQMSGGEKQRVGIARALSTNPRFIVCDEAVSALDVSVQASILNLLLDLREQLRLAYLFITHDLSVVSYIADRICVMRQGTIVEVGSTEAIIDSPQHPYTKALLAAVPKVPELRANLDR